MEKLPNPWRCHSSRRMFDNPWFSVDEDEVTNPGGGISHYGKILFKNYALGIIPLDDDMNTCLVGQYRYVPDEYSWEIPMGGGPLNIDIIESAQCELREETGLSANQWTEILHLHTSNSITDEVGYVFLARDLTEGEPEFEETEDLQIMKLPLKDAVSHVHNGDITDAISVAGLLKLSYMLDNNTVPALT